ncbi:MAG: glycosyltransferase family 9 protein, partial [Rhodospirillaceae bacterium]
MVTATELDQPAAAPLEPRPRHIAIFRALQLGDLLCTVPAWRALRAAYPDAKITLIGLPWARELAHRYVHYIDDFLEFPGAPGLPERVPDADEYPSFVHAARSLRLDLLIQMHGSGELTNPLVASWGARRIAGYSRDPAAITGDDILLPWQDGEHEVRRFLRLAAAVGAPSQGEHLEFPIRHAEQRAIARALEGVAKDYVCVHPGARYPSRRWPPERFAAVADALADRGLQIIVTGGSPERPLAEEVIRRMRHTAIDFTGRTTLGTFAALVSRARLVVSNDTGMSHVAAAVQAPSVVISSGADAERWRPLDIARHRTLWHPVPCRPCAHWVCPTEHECARGVTVQ